jgi:hypothetical protein
VTLGNNTTDKSGSHPAATATNSVGAADRDEIATSSDSALTEIARSSRRAGNFALNIQRVEEELASLCPVSAKFVALHLLKQHCFSSETPTIATAKEEFIAKALRKELVFLNAIEKLGFTPDSVSITARQGREVGTAEVVVQGKEPLPSSATRELVLTFKQQGSKLGYVTVPDEYAQGDSKALYHTVAGYARECQLKIGETALVADRVESARDLAFSGTLFEFIDANDGDIAVGAREYVKSLQARPEAQGPACVVEKFGKIQETWLADRLFPRHLRGELTAIEARLREPLMTTGISDVTTARGVIDQVFEVQRGELGSINVVAIEGANIEGELARVRSADLFAPLAAREPTKMNFKEVLKHYPAEHGSALQHMISERFGSEGLKDAPVGSPPYALQMAVRFLREQVNPILERATSATKVSPEIICQTVEALANSVNGQPVLWPYYYALFKSQSPIRTGASDAKIGIAELEMIRRVSEVAHTGKEKYGINLKFLIVDECTGLVGRFGITDDTITYNQGVANRFISHVGAKPYVEVRGIKNDIQAALGHIFDTEYADSTGRARQAGLSAERTYVGMTAISSSELSRLGVGEDEQRQLQLHLLRERKDTRLYPIPALNTVVETLSDFNGLMELRPLATEHAKLNSVDIPEFSPSAQALGVTRKASRLTMDPTVDFLGNAVTPIHGLPCYAGGEFQGNVPLWKVAAHPEHFTAYADQAGKIHFVEYTISRSAYAAYVEKEAGLADGVS